jgi:hypothetical protein
MLISTPRSSVASHGGRVSLSLTLAHPPQLVRTPSPPTLGTQYYPLGLYFALGYHPLLDFYPEHPLNFWQNHPQFQPSVGLRTGYKSRGYAYRYHLSISSYPVNPTARGAGAHGLTWEIVEITNLGLIRESKSVLFGNVKKGKVTCPCA